MELNEKIAARRRKLAIEAEKSQQTIQAEEAKRLAETVIKISIPNRFSRSRIKYDHQ